MKNSALKKVKNLKYEKKDFTLYRGDCFKIFKNLITDSVDCIITDPPYFLSNGGITCKNGAMVSVDKGDWDIQKDHENILNFNLKWIKESYRILKPGGTLWVSGTYHNIFTLGFIFDKVKDFKILNNITWVKNAPPPNLSCRFFTHSTETLLWIRKGTKTKHTFNYQLMKKINNNKQMKDVWVFGRPKKKEKLFGSHPTQKPEELIERLVLSSTNENDLILDMFCGSGTTGVISIRHKRKFIGIESENDYYVISKKRLNNELLNKQYE